MSNCVIGFRIDEKLANLLRKVCEARGEDVSSFVRRAVKRELALLTFLSEEEKKALGISAMTLQTLALRSKLSEPSHPTEQEKKDIRSP
jgi:hypothetical protein